MNEFERIKSLYEENKSLPNEDIEKIFEIIKMLNHRVKQQNNWYENLENKKNKELELLNKENENLIDTTVELKLSLKNKDKAIHNLIVENNEMEKDIYDLKEIIKNYDAISVTDTDDFKVCIFSAKYFEKGFIKKNLISKNKLRRMKEDFKKHCNECGFKHLDICEHCFYKDRINLINEILEEGDDKNE